MLVIPIYTFFSLLCLITLSGALSDPHQKPLNVPPPPPSPGCKDNSFKHVPLKGGGYECVRTEKHCSGYFVTGTDGKKKWLCCPNGKFYSFSSAGMGGCCPANEQYEVDPSTIKPRRGGCCKNGLKYHWTNELRKGTCCPPKTHLSVHKLNGIPVTMGCCTTGQEWQGTHCAVPSKPKKPDEEDCDEKCQEEKKKPKPVCDLSKCSRGGCCPDEVKEKFHGDRVVVAFGPNGSWFFDVPGKIGTRGWSKLPRDISDQFTRNDKIKVQHVYDLSLSPDGQGCIAYRAVNGTDWWHITDWVKYRQLTEWFWWQGPGNHTRPGCIRSYNFTLGPSGTFYAKSDFGHRWSGNFHPKFHDVIQKRLGDCQRFAPTIVALGIKDSFVLVDRQGYFAWHLNLDYPTLHAVLQQTKGGNLQYVALHPHEKDNWFVQFKDGSVRFKVPADMNAHVTAKTKLLRRVNIALPQKPAGGVR